MAAITGKSLCSRSLTVCGNIPKNAWILDSGVTNHMTFDSTLLCSYTTPSSSPYITVVDGSHACVVGTGNIDLQPPFQLQFVLHDLTTGQTIGIAKEKEGLYYFSDDHPKGENISDLESKSKSESEFLILGPSLPRTPISVPSLEPELSRSLSLSPSSTPESEPVSIPGPSRPSVLQESAPPAPTLVYHRRSKPDLLQKQIQSPEPEVIAENDSSSDDCAISDTCDTNPVDLPIALRKDKRSCPSLYRHPISQYVSTKHLSTQYQSFIAAVDSVKIPSFVEEVLQNRNWVQAMDEEMRALEKMADIDNYMVQEFDGAVNDLVSANKRISLHLKALRKQNLLHSNAEVAISITMSVGGSLSGDSAGFLAVVAGYEDDANNKCLPHQTSEHCADKMNLPPRTPDDDTDKKCLPHQML
ncbi:hypothetical protein KIW84_071355 [Lathyrus oleraceus]|uniref:Retrovirus-related Pol polyprotein from transposon TNT 1-94-like beta-barrel domain-containing protein n=1 Tax=Pisum sativum TaxID=3888 RepID=A0A9D4VIU6_PEA|nr:hypothetical protein KIW84_071355 [Pisum sativum]